MIVLVAVAALASAQAADPAQSQSPGKTLEALQTMYDQSCQVRAYGSYDDLCSTLRKQIGDAKRQLARAKPRTKPIAAPPSAETAVAASAPASAALATRN